MKGEFLVREGEFPDGMYLLKEGTLEVVSEPSVPNLVADWNQGPFDPDASGSPGDEASSAGAEVGDMDAYPPTPRPSTPDPIP